MSRLLWFNDMFFFSTGILPYFHMVLDKAPNQILPSLQVASRSDPTQVQITEQQRLLGGRPECEQAIMLPHDILSCLYEFPHIFHPLITGEPGRLDDYWVQNQDLRESLEMPNLEFRPSWIQYFGAPEIVWSQLTLFLGGPTRGLSWILVHLPPKQLRTHQDVFLYGSTGMGRMPSNILRFSHCCPFWVAAHQHLIPVSFSMSVIRRRLPRKPVEQFWRLLHGALKHCEPWWR